MSFVTAKAEAQPPILYILHHYGTTSKKDARTATLSFPVPMGATTPDAAPLGYCWVGNWKLGRKEYGTSFTTLLTGVRPPSIRKVRYKKKYNDNATRTLTYRLCTNNGLNVNAEIKGWEREIREEVYGEGVSLVVKARAEYYLDVLAMILKTYNGMGTLSSRKGGWLKFFEGEGVGEAEVWEMLGTGRGLNLVGGGENSGGGGGGRGEELQRRQHPCRADPLATEIGTQGGAAGGVDFGAREGDQGDQQGAPFQLHDSFKPSI